MDQQSAIGMAVARLDVTIKNLIQQRDALASLLPNNKPNKTVEVLTKADLKKLRGGK